MKNLILTIAFFLFLISQAFSTTVYIGYGSAKNTSSDFNITVNIVPFPMIKIADKTPPFILDYKPKIVTYTQGETVTFWFKLYDEWQPKGIWYGIYLNGNLDQNGFAEATNSIVEINYNLLQIIGDKAFIVVHTVTDQADNNFPEMLKTANFEYAYKVNLENIQKNEMLSAAQALAYSSFIALGGNISFIFLLIIAIAVIFICLKMVAQSSKKMS